jgi:very-short-patch-repair endonuclease
LTSTLPYFIIHQRKITKDNFMPKDSLAEAKKINQDIIDISNNVIMTPQKKFLAFKELYVANKAKLNAVNFATLIHRLGQTGDQATFSIKKQYQSLCKEVLNAFSDARMFTTVNTQACANILNACAKLSINHPNLDQVLSHFIDILAEANTQACANVLNACAKLDIKRHELVQVLSRFIGILAETGTQSCANVLNACAKLYINHPELVQVASRFITIIAKASAQECANVLNACAKLPINPPELDRVPSHFIDILAEASTQSCANVLNACAKLDIKHPGLVRVLSRFIDILAEANTQDCANVLNACAKLGIKHPGLARVANRFIGILAEANTQSCANVLNAYAKLGIKHPGLARVANRFIDILAEANTQDCANVLNACAKLGIKHSGLAQVANRFIDTLAEANSQECANVCSALITLNHINATVFDTIVDHYTSIQRDIKNNVEIVRAIIIFSIINQSLPLHLKDNLQNLLPEVLQAHKEIPEDNYYSFYETLAALQYGLLPSIQLNFKIDLDALFKKFTLLAEKSYHPEGTSNLEKLWVSHISPYLATAKVKTQTYKGAFELDLLVNDQVDIEIDGPQHYFFEKGCYHLRFTDQARDKILTSMGIQVIRLPFYELDKALASEDIDAYLDKKLKGVKMALAQEPQEEAASVASAALPMLTNSDQKHAISEKKTEEEWTLVTSHRRSRASAAATTIIPTDITIAATHQTQPSAITTTPEEQPLSRHKIKQRKKQAAKQAEALSKIGLLKETTSAHVEDEQAPKQQQRICPRCVLL